MLEIICGVSPRGDGRYQTTCQDMLSLSRIHNASFLHDSDTNALAHCPAPMFDSIVLPPRCEYGSPAFSTCHPRDGAATRRLASNFLHLRIGNNLYCFSYQHSTLRSLGCLSYKLDCLLWIMAHCRINGPQRPKVFRSVFPPKCYL